MDLVNYFILGVIEGFTEFLPVSSTAHLILISKILNIQQTDFHKFFEIFIQIGAMLAVFLNYFTLIINKKNIIKKIFVSLVPTVIIGLIFYKLIKKIFFENTVLIIFALFSVGFLFLLVEFLIKHKKIKLENKLENLNYFQAFLIGVFQGIAIVPGVSRAGAVILSMLILKFQREDAVLYSFLLGAPTIFLAGTYDLYKTGYKSLFLDSNNFFYLIIGFVTSFIFALLSIKWLINYLQKHNLNIFGYYRIILAIIYLILFS